jgi:hypothetical protein
MPGNPRELITGAERRFPVRIRIAVPPEGLGRQHARMTAWLDENCGADGWAMTPSGTRGVLNDAVSIYFPDAALAGAFVARWCIGYKVETAEGVFRMREDEPAPGRGGAFRRVTRSQNTSASNRILERVRRTSVACTTPLNPNQSTGAGDNSVEKRCPVEPKSGGCLLPAMLA